MLEKDINYLKELKKNMKIKIKKHELVCIVDCVINNVIKIKENGIIFYFEEIDIEKTKEININFFMEDKIKELEKLGKQIVVCKKYRYEIFKDIILVHFIEKNKKIEECCYTVSAEEKEEVFITDDFIFIKE